MTYYVKPFDPWKSPLCTCRPKYSLNPYTGCAHQCVYCYATYIPDFFNLRLKKNLFEKLKKDIEKLPQGSIVSLSNSSDPYPSIEKDLNITRKCLEILLRKGFKVFIVTKSDLVLKDLEIFRKYKNRVVICITITSLDPLAKTLEPGAPSPERRLKALKKCKEEGLKVVLRLDPIIPFLTEKDAMEILEKTYFVDHVVMSTLKLRKDIIKRMEQSFPEWIKKVVPLYTEKVYGNYFYLKINLRKKVLTPFIEFCENKKISYGFCRENILFKGKTCDGSHLFNIIN